MDLILGAVMMVFGILSLIRGELKLSESLVVKGTAARAAGLLLASSLALAGLANLACTLVERATHRHPFGDVLPHLLTYIVFTICAGLAGLIAWIGIRDQASEPSSVARDPVPATGLPFVWGSLLAVALAGGTVMLLSKGMTGAPSPPDEPTPVVESAGRGDELDRLLEQTVSHAPAALLEEEACRGGDGDACAEVAQRYFDGDGVAKDFGRAVELYRKACDAGSADGCGELGYMYQHGLGVETASRRAYALYATACRSGSIAHCANQADLLLSGDGTARDPARAARLYARACGKGDDDLEPDACFNLGVMLADGLGVRREPKRAVPLYERACDGDSFEACTNLGFMLMRGLGAPRNATRARIALKKACDGQDGLGCTHLADLYDRGDGVPVDRRRAAVLLATACDRDDSLGCYNLARKLADGAGIERDSGAAARLFKKACALGDKAACGR